MPGENMADKQKTIDIIFGGIDKTGSAFNSVGSGLSSLEKNVSNVTAPLANITESILKLDAVLATAAIGLTAYGIKVADEFGTSFAEISTLIGEPAENLEDFRNQLQRYAEQSSQSFQEITDATYNAISAGVDYKDSLSVIEQAEQLSIAGRADLGTTTKALVSTLNAFGAEMSDAGDFADIFFTVVQKGQTTLPELADSIGNVAPLAAQAGLTFDELGAAIAAITAGAGISTTEAMTALQGALSNIIKPTSQAADLAEELGINLSASALESKGFSGVLEEVKEKTGGSVEQMALLFGNVRSLKAVLPLTGSAADDFASTMAAMERRTGAAGNAASQLQEDLGLLSQTLKNNVQSAFISFGDNLTDEAAESIKALSNIFNSIGDEIALDAGAFAPIINQLEGVFQDIQAKLEAVAENMPEALSNLDLSDMVRAFDDLGAELSGTFRALFGDIDLSTVEGLESALQTIVDAFTSLIDLSSGIVSGLEPLFELISKGAKTFNELSDEQKQASGGLLGFATSINTLLPLLGGMATAITAVGTAVVTLAGFQGLKSLLGSLGGLATVAAKAGPTGLIGTAVFGTGYVAGKALHVEEGINSIVRFFSDSESLGDLIYEWVNGDENALEQLPDKLSDANQAAGEFAKGQEGVADAFKDSAEFVELDIEALNADIEAKIDAKKAQQDLTNEMEAGADAQEKSAGILSFVANESKKTAQELGEAARQTEDFKLKLLELASDERIANIEANVELNIAELEAETKRAVAIIENLGTSITSTGDLLGELFNAQNDASKFDKLGINQQIRAEEERRQQAFEKQQLLTDAEIDLIRQKAAALSKGDALIKVNAEGLTPALEMIFNEVLEFAQVRANEQGLEFLTGL